METEQMHYPVASVFLCESTYHHRSILISHRPLMPAIKPISHHSDKSLVRSWKDYIWSGQSKSKEVKCQCTSTSLKIRDYVLQPDTISGTMASNITVLHTTYYCIANSICEVWIQFYKQQLISTPWFRHVTRTRTQLQAKTAKNSNGKNIYK